MTQNTNHNRILLVGYHFPPSVAVGGHRIAGFARHLKEFGWIPHVLTIRERHIEKKDPGTLNGLGDLPIFRTGVIPDVTDAYLKIKVLHHRLKNRRKVTRRELEEAYALSHSSNEGNRVKKNVLKHNLLALLVTLPDKERGWILPAVYRAAKIMRRNQYHCILTTSPPYSVHIIGYILKTFFKVGWVVDFRDPWMTPSGKRLYPTTPLSNAIESEIERRVINKADLVLSNTELLKEKLVSKYRDISEKKFICLPNGFEKNDFKELNDIEKYKKFTISYTGTLYLGRSPEPVFRALNELAKKEGYDIEKIQLLLVGNCRLINGRRISDLVSSYGLESTVEVRDPVSHKQAMEIIQKSHLALLLAPDQPFQIPGKAFEYIGANAKILAIAGKGSTADLITKNNFGEVFNSYDIDGIKRFIKKEIQKPNHDVIKAKNSLSIKFSHKYLSKQLADHLTSKF